MRKLLNIARSGDTINTLAARMDGSERVFFSRWGDGEIGFMSGQITATPEENLRRDLRFDLFSAFCISDENYLRSVSGYFPHEEGFERGIIGGSMQSRDALEQFVHSLEPQTTNYLNPIAFNYAVIFEPAMFLNFLDEHIRPKRKMFVGSASKSAMEKVFGPIDHHIETPQIQAYQDFPSWFPRIIERVDDVELIVLCSGMSANVAMGILWKCGYKVSCIDFGSFVDAMDYRSTRNFIKKYGDQIRSLFQ